MEIFDLSDAYAETVLNFPVNAATGGEIKVASTQAEACTTVLLHDPIYCTINVTVVVCCTVPEVPVTVTGYVPAGVPVFEPTFGKLLPAQPLE